MIYTHQLSLGKDVVSAVPVGKYVSISWRIVFGVLILVNAMSLDFGAQNFLNVHLGYIIFRAEASSNKCFPISSHRNFPSSIFCFLESRLQCTVIYTIHETEQIKFVISRCMLPHFVFMEELFC